MRALLRWIIPDLIAPTPLDVKRMRWEIEAMMAWRIRQPIRLDAL